MYYHATQEKAEVSSRVQYTTWIKSQGEEIMSLESYDECYFEGGQNGFISEVLMISLAAVTIFVTM